MNRTTALLLTFLALPAAAHAGDVDVTIAQKQGWAEYDAMITEKASAVNTACGTKLTASFDRKSYPTFDRMKDRTEAPCRDLMNALVTVCASAPGREGVQKLTHVTCRYQEARTGLSVSGTTLIVDISPTQTSIVGKEKGSYSWKAAIEELL